MGNDHRIAGTPVADVADTYIFDRQLHHHRGFAGVGAVIAVAVNIFHGHIVDVAGNVTCAVTVTVKA